MRRGLIGVMTALTIISGSALVLAAEQPPPQAAHGASAGEDGVIAITDAFGNPVPREAAAGVPRPNLNAASGRSSPDVQRGRAWWPYKSALPPYTSVDVRAEAMGEDEILVKGVVVLNARNPEAALRQIPAELLLGPEGQAGSTEGFYLVKIKGFARTQQQIDALRQAGVELGEYININTYIARISPVAVAAVKALPFVTYVGDYHPAYKISPRIGLEKIPWDRAFDAASGKMRPWDFELTLHKGADPKAVENALSLLGAALKPEEAVLSGESKVLVVETEPETVPSLAKIPGVKWIAERTYPELMASSTSPATIPMILQNNGVFTTSTATGWKLWNAGLDGDRSGTAQIVTLMDTGLNTNMEHFSEDAANVGTIGPSHRKVVGYDNFGGDLCVTSYSAADGGHGTWTSQHAVGSISNMVTNPDPTHTPTTYYDDGIASAAKVYFQDIGNSAGGLTPPSDLSISVATAISKGSYIQNHSWGARTNTYDARADNLDTILYANPGFIITVSAGNAGTSGAGSINNMCTAKNAICVGGNDAFVPDALFEDCNWDGTAACGGANDLGSSRGPVAVSGRIKPDVTAFMAFSNLVGGEREAGNRPALMCQTDVTKNVYWDWMNDNGFGGTSFSAPEVAGLAALVRDYFQAGFYPTGTATPANALTPSGSLVKAVILASGEDMSVTASPTASIAVGKRYSNDVGYGRANLPGVLHLGSTPPFLWVQNDDALGEGSTRTFYYTLNGNGIPLRVMMTYYDANGDVLQKDADLRVTIGSTVYYGNNFSGGWSTSATTTADHTNNTEAVFLNAASGLPATGTVRVDVIGYNNPAGMNYSLVVSGDVAAQNVTQVYLDQGKYTCDDAVHVTVNDAAATSPVSVTLTSKNGGGTTIDTQVVSCTGSGGVFTGSIQTGTGIAVVDGGTITATYGVVTPATSTISCQVALTDGGFLIYGGCDNNAAGTDSVGGPLTSGGSNEYYNKYMDGGEYTSYTVGFTNLTGVALTDVSVSLSFSGAGASKMTVLNNPVHVGAVPINGLTGAVFQVYTDPSASGLTAVNMDFDVTSPADGYTTPKRLTQVQYLQSNDIISRQGQCSTFNTALTPWYESTVTGRIANPWRWIGSATTPGTVGSENRVDGACGNATANAGAMVGNSATTSNFALNADSFLLQNFQPALRDNAPNGQPYHYVWKWHSFYHASEVLGNQGAVWGAFYNHRWNSAVNPTADQALGFPLAMAYYYHTIFDYVGTWNWETANTGTPDDPRLGPSSGGAPNQLFVTFPSSASGLATSSTWFSYGHEHLDVCYLTTCTTRPPRRDVALDNDRLVYDEYYTGAQAGASCGGGGQVGQVAFDRYSYSDCPRSTAVLSVVDANAVSPLTVTVTSPGTGDSEVVTLTGTAPYFSGTVVLATDTGIGSNNGVLFVLPDEIIGVTYTDVSPAGSTTASARVNCQGGDVVYVSNAQASDNGDNDGYADNNETVNLDITIKNNLGFNLTNARVEIFATTPGTVDCVPDAVALYGTVPAGGTATNPAGDRFTFHVNPAVACTDWQNPPIAQFVAVITGGGLDGPAMLQKFSIRLDLDSTASGGSYTYTQAFAADPGWSTSPTPDDDGSCAPGYVNNFHWCAACGNAGGGYGAWIGDSAFGTSGQNYADYDSSTLYSPIFVANGNVYLNFDLAYRTEATYDGALVQFQVNGGAWTDLPQGSPAQGTTTASNYCSPLAVGATAWTGPGVSWTTTAPAGIAASVGQTVRYRWRLGSDSVTGGSPYGGYGVDNVVVTGLKQTELCEPTRNTGLPGCAPDLCAGVTCTALDQCHVAGVCNPATGLCSNPTAPNGTTCNDGNACTDPDTCTDGVCGGIPITAPAEVGSGVTVERSGTDALINWILATGAGWSDVLKGLVSALPVGPGGGDETCLANDTALLTATDTEVPATGAAFWYLVRGGNACGNGSYGYQGVNGVPGAQRTSTTCP